ncbi:MAG: ABC transporter permease [Candidatus Bipolaricaulota bacterium]|nr:ABC transporter permease [Candidatus Bipolaricaulota bacterium]
MARLALRNLSRNRRRTLLSAGIVALGCALSLVVLGFVERSRALIQETTVQQFGNLQIADPKLLDGKAEGFEYLVSPAVRAQVEGLVRPERGVVGTTAQLSLSGLLAVRRTTAVVRAVGVVPENDVLDYNDLVVTGRGLRADDVGTVLVGQTLADELGLRPGDFVNLTATTVAGAFNVSPLEVVGLFRFSSAEVERAQVFVPLAFAQLLLATDGVDRIVVRLDRLGRTWAAARAIGARLAAAQLPLEVRTWDVLSPFYRGLSGFFDLLFGFLVAAVFILVFFIVLQILTLSFLERTREVGTIRALGTRRGEVFGLFVEESLWLGLAGGGIGVVAGVGISLLFNAAGIPWQPPGTVQAVTLGVDFTAPVILIPFGVSVISTVASAFLPAYQATRVSVVDALRAV